MRTTGEVDDQVQQRDESAHDESDDLPGSARFSALERGVSRDDSFVAAVDSTAPWLYRYAWLACGNREDSEDIVAAAAAKTFVRNRQVTIDNVPGYLRRAVTNELIARGRRLHRRPSVAARDDERTSPDEVDDRIVVWSAVRQLPPRQRIVVTLRYGLDLTESETAEAMGTSVGTVKSQHAKAMSRLRKLLGEP
jgi:RNA polymerase sigma factor (sigma-70 family)